MKNEEAKIEKYKMNKGRSQLLAKANLGRGTK
jgi:hypothetical protein